MKTYKYRKIDAFTSSSSAGNPAAYLDLGLEQLSDKEMLEIARDHKGFVSNVIFRTSLADGTTKLTYFSSECEVSFCGHGTIATMFEVISSDPFLLNSESVEFETNRKGRLKILNRIQVENSIYITAPEALWIDLPVSIPDIANALKIAPGKISVDYPIDFIDAGLRTLIVPISNLVDEISLFPNEIIMKNFCIKFGVDIILIFSLETKSEEYIAHTRVFTPKFGRLEDPATGSGNSAFGKYMIKNQIWKEETAKIEQGSNRINFNEIRLKNLDGKVLFGGSATKRIEGHYFVK